MCCRRCGIFPFDPDLVDYSKLVSSHIASSSSATTESNKLKIRKLQETIDTLETRIDPSDLVFMQTISKGGIIFPQHDVRLSLYNMWSGLKRELEEALVSAPEGKIN